MAHLKQSKKRILTNEKARVRNKQQRSSMKSAIKRTTAALGTPDAKTTLSEAKSRIDKAAKKNVIHKNAAARLKSRLAKKVTASAK